MNRTCCTRGTTSIRFTDSIVSRNLQHTHRTQTVSRAAITTHAMQPSVQGLNMAWVDHCLCSMSKDVTPLRNGDAKGWIWGEVVQNVSCKWTRKGRKVGFRPNRFEVSVTYILHCKYFWQIAALQQCLTMQSVNDMLWQNCVLQSCWSAKLFGS